ncbi:hypothetical protein KR51_00022900 [Rubidibacter lacunae KORDI 51-2]|uniref:Uncharacterized protein n=1 Tax=Rubidibacter lacunae KORDI 51-2 TaxID=582515 RepID=U5D8V9_9CHRO|nr:hypothetical protein KR51_00022900 [Rubidibacter lacunae KORDI 51-2]
MFGSNVLSILHIWGLTNREIAYLVTDALAWIIHELLCGDPKPFAVQGLQTFSLNDSAFLYEVHWSLVRARV